MFKKTSCADHTQNRSYGILQKKFAISKAQYRLLGLPFVESQRNVLTAARKSSASSVATAPTAISSDAPSTSFLSSDAMTTITTTMFAYHIGIFLLILLLGSFKPVLNFMKSAWPVIPIALAYGLLLANSWSPDTLSLIMPGSLEEGLQGGIYPQFFPKLEGIMVLFQRPATAASWLLHICAINLFLGRSIYLEGHSKGVATAHSLVLACVAGPVGLLSHLLTKALRKPPREAVVISSGEAGSITILPYRE
ncbi:hypothetical protein CEUSTIGMA_g9370.t1 [Chlamydomonas eustigma]|uniref:Uncharacterized protein n=1 Tax=Chlamydomonas eustigma TaxID=1157962 RepID=A0A250XG97_9CHLO|nr:hypothetical protein CEUSTIGMA_g9370.t1 [Chlamydomonas eustigma]|eukprot:GAX81942.1 hypothetical protein CEUSTIGMA_g9370.t1 [Chlamydomonas eustigma]